RNCIVYNTDNSLKLFQKRKQNLVKKNILPSDLLELIAFAYDNQLKTYESSDADLPRDQELTEQSQVLSGKPLLQRASFPVDMEAALDLFDTLLDYLKSSSGHLRASAETVEQEIKNDPDLPSKSFENYLQGQDQFFRLFGEKTPESPRTLNFLTQTAITPPVAKTASRLNLALPADHTWTFGHCPVCGSLPFISSLQGKQGFRMLHCSFCHTSYRFKRMLCPYCHENKESSFHYFNVSEHPGFRVDVCKTCNMYIKTTDFREMDKKYLPVMDDLESLTLDIMARNQGFNRPTLSAWGF
ncbi:MAG: formate dehydrogenase accessory protein FdhE, partial [Desulfonatronovibrio sp.]